MKGIPLRWLRINRRTDTTPDAAVGPHRPLWGLVSVISDDLYSNNQGVQEVHHIPGAGRYVPGKWHAKRSDHSMPECVLRYARKRDNRLERTPSRGEGSRLGDCLFNAKKKPLDQSMIQYGLPSR